MVLLTQYVAVMPIPVTLEQLLWIPAAFLSKEFWKLGIAGEQLSDSCVPVVSQKVTALMVNREIDQRTKRIAALRETASIVIDMQIENDAGEVLSCPGQESGFIAANQT